MWKQSLLSLLCLVVSSLCIAQANQASEEFAQLLKPINSMTAKFQQQTLGHDGRILQKANGSMAVARPNKFRWYTLSPNKQLIVTNGKLLWIYDVDLEQVSVRYLKKMQNNTPAMLLSGSVKEVEKYYQIQLMKSQDDLKVFRLLPKKKEGVFQQLTMNFKDGRLVLMSFKDSLGQLVNVKFNQIKLNPVIPAKQFNFKPPPHVDVIGMKGR